MWKHFQNNFHFAISSQALNTQTVEFLVGLLDQRIEQQDNQASTKAQIVKALKAMQRSLRYGQQVRYIIWYIYVHVYGVA